MWLTTLLLVVGFSLIAIVYEGRDRAARGVIPVPLLAVYTLYEYFVAPVFLASLAVAYAASRIVGRYRLSYGRVHLAWTLVAGGIVPFALFVALGLGLDPLSRVLPFRLRSELFVGALLPGLVASHLDGSTPERRRRDLLVGVGLFVGLLTFGTVLVAVGPARPFGDALPTALFRWETDIVALLGATDVGGPRLDPLARPVVVGASVVGIAAVEGVRSRLGHRLGFATLALLPVFIEREPLLLVQFAVVGALAFGVIEAVNRRTVLSGTPLHALALALACLLSLFVAVPLPTERGLWIVLTGVLAGRIAFAVHMTARAERLHVVGIASVCVGVLSILVRVAGEPFGSPPRSPGFQILLVGLVLAVGVFALAGVDRSRRKRLERHVEAVLSPEVTGEHGSTESRSAGPTEVDAHE